MFFFRVFKRCVVINIVCSRIQRVLFIILSLDIKISIEINLFFNENSFMIFDINSIVILFFNFFFIV